MTNRTRPWLNLWRVIIVTVSLLFVLEFIGCSRQSSEPPMLTGAVITSAQASGEIGAWCGDESYAVVSTEWLRWHYTQFRSGLSAGAYGITQWDAKYDCNRFAAKFAADAQVCFFARSFHSRLPAKAAAVGEYWYRQSVTVSHAVVIARTESGWVLLEPQSGRITPLTEGELSARILSKL